MAKEEGHLRRPLGGITRWLILCVCVILTLFQIYTASLGALPDIQHPAVYVLLGFTIIFALWGATKADMSRRTIPFYDIILILIAAVTCINIIIRHEKIMVNPVMYTKWDVAFGACLILLVMEAARRTIGWTLPLLAATTIVYSWATGSSLEFIIAYQYHHDQGMWGTLTYIGATIISIFLILGSFLLFTGGGQTFIDIANRAFGKYRGGPAKIAVMASGLFGMISGSAVANVATTGNFTIPLMKEVGYKPETAGAIESVASTGGMIMPPIMGSSAFVMAELLGISYAKICLYAALPAILYFSSVYFFVHFTAVKERIEPYRTELSVYEILTWERMAPLALPIIAFVIFLAKGFTPIFSGFLASILCLITFILRNLNLSEMKGRLKQLSGLFAIAGISIAYVVPLMTCAQIVVGMLGESGLATKLASAVITLGESYKILALIAAGVLAIILGMGVPPLGAYVLAVAVAGPALMRLGIQEIPAHFFVLNFANFGAITPPVCAAVFMAAAIAKSNWLKTGFQAVKIALSAMILPFSYTIFEPYLLGWGPAWLVIVSFLLAFLATLFISSATSGGFFQGSIDSPFYRLCFGIGGFLFLIPFDWHQRLIGAGLILLALVRTLRLATKGTKGTAPDHGNILASPEPKGDG